MGLSTTTCVITNLANSWIYVCQLHAQVRLMVDVLLGQERRGYTSNAVDDLPRHTQSAVCAAEFCIPATTVPAGMLQQPVGSLPVLQ